MKFIDYARRRRQGFSSIAAEALSDANPAVGYVSIGILALCATYLLVEALDLFF